MAEALNSDEADAHAFAIARQLIAKHGINVAGFLEMRIDELTAAGDLNQLLTWFQIRNAVAISLASPATLQ